MNRQWQWELAPCHDLSFSQGADGAHRMPVMGESRAPAAADLLRLAADAALPPRWAAGVITHMAERGGMFAALARMAPIRAATVKTISRAIEANRLRM
jgi:serine/threonine-protein kinase HipA